MAVSTIYLFGKWLSRAELWLPANKTWDYLAGEGRNANRAKPEDLCYGVLVAVGLLVIRYTLERRAFRPLGVRLGIKDRGANHRSQGEERVFTRFFVATGHPMTQERTVLLANALRVSERTVQLWVRQRTMQEKKLAKFGETAWRFAFYAGVFGFGLRILWDKPWLWDTMHCWYDMPHHPVSDAIWWYYMIQLGFYVSCTLSHFISTRRRDFWQMFSHHIVSILLLCLSWSFNLHRIGSLVLVVHDFADVSLEAARMARYVKRQRLADATFALFTISWVVSRLGLYPYRVVYSAMFESVRVVGPCNAHLVFCLLLLALQFMHVVWTWMIARAAVQAIADRGIKRLGSDDESSGDDDQVVADSTGPRQAGDIQLESKTQKLD